MSELRALTRLTRGSPADTRGPLRVELEAVLATFTEGEATADLIEAREVAAIDRPSARGAGQSGGLEPG
jgi:hypothetical protein